MIRILVILLLSCNLAVAQISQQTITNDITNNLPTNNIQEISAQLLRNTLNAMTSAIFQSQGLNGLTITGTPTIGQVPVATSSSTASWQTIGGTVSVSNGDGTLNISPITGVVIASLNTAHANIWTTIQTFNASLTANITNVTSNVNIGSLLTVGTPIIQFYSSGNSNYDTRLVSTGGNANPGGGTLIADGTLEIVPQASSLQSAITSAQTAHGSTGGTQYYANLINVSSDDVDAGSSVSTSYSLGLYVQHVFGGSNATGGREGIFGNLILTSATNSSNAVRFYTAVSGQGQANASDGGTIGSSLEKGKMYGSNFIGALSNGATGFEQIMAGYDQIFMLAGSSAKTKAIRALVYGGVPVDAVQGSTYDAALMIGAETGAIAGGKNAILIGNMFGANPLSTTGSILTLANAQSFTLGIDLGNGTFSTGSFRSPNFLVDGSGNATAANFRSGGNIAVGTGTAPPSGGNVSLAYFLSSSNVGIYTGSGNPTISAVKGSLYLENGAGQIWINTSGSTTWTQITVP